MAQDQRAMNHRSNMSSNEQVNLSSGTVIPLDNQGYYSGQRRVSFSSTTKKLVFPTKIKMEEEEDDDDALHYDKENYDQNCYNQDIMKPINVLHNDKENNRFSHDDVINEIGEYEDCSEEDDDEDEYDLDSPLQENVHSLTPIPVNHRPAVYPHQYHAARYGIYPQNLQQSQSYNGFYYSPPPIYPYPSSMSQLQYVPIASPELSDEQRSTKTNSKSNEKSDGNSSTATQVPARPRGGVSEPFPDKLYRMIETCEKDGKTDVVSFSVHGTSFAIHKPKRFTAEVMTRFFKQSKLTSFQRQLNLYGFKRISTGPDIGAYWHPLFLKNKPQLCSSIKRTKIKGNDKNARIPHCYMQPAHPGFSNVTTTPSPAMSYVNATSGYYPSPCFPQVYNYPSNQRVTSFQYPTPAFSCHQKEQVSQVNESSPPKVATIFNEVVCSQPTPTPQREYQFPDPSPVRLSSDFYEGLFSPAVSRFNYDSSRTNTGMEPNSAEKLDAQLSHLYSV